MITYKAMFKFYDDGVFAQLLDFPAVVTSGADLGEARRMVRAALEEMVEAYVMDGDPLPRPDPTLSDPDADLEEPVHLLLTAASLVATVPVEVAS